MLFYFFIMITVGTAIAIIMGQPQPDNEDLKDKYAILKWNNINGGIRLKNDSWKLTKIADINRDIIVELTKSIFIIEESRHEKSSHLGIAFYLTPYLQKILSGCSLLQSILDLLLGSSPSNRMHIRSGSVQSFVKIGSSV